MKGDYALGEYLVYKDIEYDDGGFDKWFEEVFKPQLISEVKVNVAGTPNALEKLFNSLPDKDKRRE